MNVSYIDPAERAWGRTRRVLLEPVEVERWIVIGFAAFLAGLAGQWAGISFTPRWSLGFPPDWGDLIQAPFESLVGAVRRSTWFLFGIPLALGAIAAGIALLWVSSRGKLVFLDNMVHGRAALVDPWKRYGRLGDSLFVWRLAFYVAAGVAFLAVLSPLYWLGRGLADEGAVGRAFGALASVAAAAGTLLWALLVGYVSLFLESFVVPLMYRREIKAVEAWAVFVPLLRERLPEFLAYGLVVAVGIVGVFLCLIAAAIATCCILPLLLSVPYLRSVLLLPLAGFFRLYSVEFLAQLGPDYVISAPEAEPPGA